MQNKAALLGESIEQSLSPKVHALLFPLLQERFDVPLDRFEYKLHSAASESDVRQWIEVHRRDSIGANFTRPLKDIAATVADKCIGVARELKSGNTLRFTSQGIECISTDGAGFMASLAKEHPDFNIYNYHLLVMGAGPAARAVTVGMLMQGMPLSFTLVNRDRKKAEHFAAYLQASAPGPTIRLADFNPFPTLRTQFGERIAVLNATPAGGEDERPLPEIEWQEADYAFDLRYGQRSSFLRSAEAARAKTMDGLGMLIEQAALSQLFWFTGQVQSESLLEVRDIENIKRTLGR